MPKGYLILTESQRSEIIQRATNKGEKVAHLASDLATISRTVFNNEKSKLCPTIKKTIIL